RLRREADALEINGLALHETLPQRLHRHREAEAGERLAPRYVGRVGPPLHLAFLELARRRHPGDEVHVEGAHRPSVIHLAPAPRVLRQLRTLAQHDALLHAFTVAGGVGDLDVETVLLNPLNEVSVGDAPAGGVAHHRVTAHGG